MSADAGDMGEPTAEQQAFFEARVRPVLIARCLDCHSGDSPESGLSLESRAALLRGGELGAAIVPGNPESSLLIQAIRHDEFLKMPPKEKLSTAEVRDLTRWVEMGAPWPADRSQPPRAREVPRVPRTRPARESLFTAEERSFWAFQPSVRPRLPAVRDAAWIRSPIDHFVLARLEAAGLQPAPPADKRALIRRASYDLTGLPPRPEETAAFLADTSADAFARVIDQLLASPRYGERWGRHWLDVARFADSNGLDENLSYANAFRYRDYVISAWNADTPYDRFVQEQIAGDLLQSRGNGIDGYDHLVATGFLAIGPKMLAEDDPVKMQMDIIDEQLSTLCQAFLGLTIGCARCHDHKFDPLPTRDYYALAGIFKSTQTMENHKVVARWYERPLAPAAVLAEITSIDRQLERASREVEAVQQGTRSRVRSEARRRVADYLLASHEIDQLDASSPRERTGTAAAPDRPFSVRRGYALIEAESFHRGSAERLEEGYGLGIGVIISRAPGFVEYDLDVDREGRYALEIRYAAQDSRPFQLLVNGAEAAAAIGGSVTGGWNPEQQGWFAEARIDLKPGSNVLRFSSPSPFPHVDRFALVYIPDGDWPWEFPAPRTLTSIAATRGVSLELARSWQEFLRKVESNELPGQTAFLPWLALRRGTAAEFDSRLAGLLAAARGDSGAGDAPARRIPPLVVRALTDASPRSLADVAAIYQELVHRVDQSETGQPGAGDKGAAPPDALRPIAEQFSAAESPLAGPRANLDAYYSREEQAQVRRIEAERKRLQAARPQVSVAMGVTEAEPEDLRVHLRGSHLTLGERAPRGFPRILAGENQAPLGSTSSGRLEFARWLTQPSHPLTARVMANRVWHWHMGRGLVASVDNFGSLGDRPTHPELLDWLAREFVDAGWSLKALHRRIMLSSTYQMSTSPDPRSAELDPENQWLWRMNRRRLSAEEIRDSIILAGSGLDLKMGGSLLKVANRAYVTVSGSNLTDEYDNRRRSVYLPVVRSAVYDVFQTLDFPDPAVSAGRRQTSTVAPQALLMLNGKLVHEHSLQCAQEVLGCEADPGRRIAAAYERILGRPPTAAEHRRAEEYLAAARVLVRGERQARASDDSSTDLKAWQSLCRALLSTNEFVYLD